MGRLQSWLPLTVRSRPSLNTLVVAIVAVGASAAAQTATVKLPLFDKRLPHPNPAGLDTFGWVMDIRELDQVSPTPVADLIIGSIQQTVHGQALTGAAYAYRGPELAEWVDFKPIVPIDFSPTTGAGSLFGELKITIGDLRGTLTVPQSNLAFIPADRRKKDQTSCSPPRAFVGQGAIDVFDFTVTPNPTSPATTFGAYQRTIVPPPLPGEGAVACGVERFGHYSALADVDGDGRNDLIVGAPKSDGSEGRAYIFFGHAGFISEPPVHGISGYSKRWMVVRPPPNPAGGPPVFPAQGQFGFCVTADDLDGDGKAEVAVTRIEKGHGPGRVHLFNGCALATAIGSASFVDFTPPAPTDTAPGCVPAPPLYICPVIHRLGVYETLVDPMILDPNAYQDPTFPIDAFGWIVLMGVGDLGGPSGVLDGKKDILIHSESAYYVTGPMTFLRPGAVFVFFGNSTGACGQSVVAESAPVKLQPPILDCVEGQGGFCVQNVERFGRSMAVAEWEDSNGNPVRIILAGSPDKDVWDMTVQPPVLRVDAGAVFGFKVPVDNAYTSAAPLNGLAWGSFVLLEPKDSLPAGQGQSLVGQMQPQAGSLFGAWIVNGRYNLGFPKDQLIISARFRRLEAVVGAGQVYSFHLATP